MGNEESAPPKQEPLIPQQIQQNGPIEKMEEKIEDKIEEKISENTEKKTDKNTKKLEKNNTKKSEENNTKKPEENKTKVEEKKQIKSEEQKQIKPEDKKQIKPIQKSEEKKQDKPIQKLEEKKDSPTEIVSNYEIEKPPIDVKQKIEDYFHTSYPINISEDVFNTKNDLIKLRRYFHANPELSFEEYETSKNILNYCDSLGLLTKSGIGSKTKDSKGTGVVAVLHGGNNNNNNNNKCIGLRADMDALPIDEISNISYKSRFKGIMHACGHDCHLAILLTVARILSQPKYVNRINGIIKFIFQTGEECGGGAKYMINDGVLKTDTELNCPKVDEIYGLHVWSYNKLGKIILKSGSLMAGAQSFNISVIGIGGHGAQPLNTSDTVLAITALNIQLHSIISRNLSPIESGVITIGTCNVGNSHNIIAENGNITGTIRYKNNDIYNIIKKRIIECCKGIELSYNVNVNIKWGENPYPPVQNNAVNVKFVDNAVNKVFPNANKQNIIIKNVTTMAAEDFSFYLNEIPGCFFFVGCGVNNENNNQNNNTNQQNDETNNKIYAHHTPNFQVDERCLLIGVQILVNLVMDLLAKPKNINEMKEEIIQDKIITTNDKS